MSDFRRLPNVIRSVFVSSTGIARASSGASAHHENISQVIHVLLSNGYYPIWMQYNPALPEATLEQSLRAVQECDIFVIIISGALGTVIDQSTTFIMLEYEMARQSRKPVLAFIADDAAKIGGSVIANFIDQIMHHTDGVTVATYSNTTELIRDMVSSLQKCVDNKDRPVSFYLRAERHHREIAQLARKIVTLEQHERRLDDANRKHAALLKIYRSVAREILNMAVGAMHNRVFLARNELEIREALMSVKDDLHNLVDVLARDWVDYPLLIHLAEENIIRLAKVFDGLTSEDGYRPLNLDDLQNVCRRLYGEDLAAIDAVSIISNKEKYWNYRKYWDHPALGRLFSQLNFDFLRRDKASIRRIFLCDSLLDSIRSDALGNWLRGSALPQCSLGAQVKVCEIEAIEDQSLIQDFGIYTHTTGSPEGAKYILLAPVEMNEASDILQTRLIADRQKTSNQQQIFDKLWNQIPFETISNFENSPCEPYREHGRASVASLLGDNIILRNGRILDVKRRVQFRGRKGDGHYATLLAQYLAKNHPKSPVIYISDSVDTDGVLVDNLRRCLRASDDNRKVAAFINDPNCGLPNVKINGIFYSDRWENLASFNKWLRQSLGAAGDWVVVTEIDETLWAPRGLRMGTTTAHEALTNVRFRAIRNIVWSYIGFPEEINADKAAEILRMVYNETGAVEHKGIVADNEDYRAILTIAISLGLLLDRSDKGIGGELLIAKGDTSWEYVDWLVDSLLKKYSKFGIMDLLYRIHYNIATSEGKTDVLQKGLNVNTIGQDWEDIRERVQSGHPTIFERFRNEELLETAAAACSDNLLESVVLNKSLYDFIASVKNAGGAVMGISDRPDEATYSPEVSLLTTPMILYGGDISGLLQ